MSRLAQLTALGFAAAAALLASAPLMLLFDRVADFDSTVVVVVAVLVALLIPTVMAVLCFRVIKAWQPQGMWLTAVLSGLALAGIAALSL